MNKKTIVTTVLATSVLVAGGFGLYRLGVQQGASRAPEVAISDVNAKPETAGVDPSTWGIPQGEKATRRHMDAGLKAGDVDPLTARKILYYHDPMVPGKKFDAPAKSPFMDMMLVPAYAGSEGAYSGTVKVSSRIQQNLGVRLGEVVEGQLMPEISAEGAVAWNERSQFAVQARATGYVEKLHVRATLDRVVKGQPLFDLYVPDWVAAQEDYLSVSRMQGKNLDTLVDAARQRMRQVGMSEAQVALIERSGNVQKLITLTAPASGVVTELLAREGSTVMPGMLLARINDLSTVWVQAEVPESQVANLRAGSPVTATTPTFPDELFKGQLQTLLPEVNAATRTRKARMELANPKGRLVPGMFVHMRLANKATRATLLLPSEALIRTGRRTLVMAVEDGSFRPVEVQVGMEQNGQSEILGGLAKEQKIVLSGQFLIDSEASLKGVEARMGAALAIAPAQSAQATYRTGARVEAVAGDTVTLTHPAIPALQWPGMTMDFKLPPGEKLPAIPAGTRIDIEFRMQEGSAPQIVKLTLSGNKPIGGAQ